VTAERPTSQAGARPAGPGGDRPAGLGPLGRRLLAAFVLVALSSVLVLTVAALVGADRGLTATRQADRQQLAARVAAAAATAYQAADGWDGADLAPAVAVADAAGARLLVRDASGATVASSAGGGHMPGMGGPGPGMGGGSAGQAGVSWPVVVEGRTVGSVRLGFTTPAGTPGRGVAWSWILLAAVTAILVAIAVSWFVTRRVSGPVMRLAAAARALAAGDRSARSGVTAPGELGELAGAFDQMADDLAHAEQVRRQLAADVAHELRTPLAALQAGLEELRDGLIQPDPARLAGLHDQTLRLGRVVDDLAELAAAESAALSLRLANVDLAQVTRAALAAQDAQLRAAGLQVHAELDPGVLVRRDADRLDQALGNLLTNAARYCRPGDQVTARVSATDGQGVVEITDTGPGVPADELPHVFDRLWRGKASSASSGSGIGLAVVRELVSAHGGTVTATSPPGSGATFTIRLPLQRAYQ
jgi:two-component system sensor histidine kinase BaeS